MAINTTDNRVPHAIGVTAHSSMDMFMAGRHGKGVSILHVYRDQLWEMGSKTPPPNLGPPDVVLEEQVVPGTVLLPFSYFYFYLWYDYLYNFYG